MLPYEAIIGRISSQWKVSGDCFKLVVEIPPNTKATVMVPAQGVENITESGYPLANHKHVRVIRDYGNHVELEVGSGNYTFVSSRSILL